MKIENIIQSIDYWINALKTYSIAQLATKPTAGSWSMGQLYVHLLQDTSYYLEQARICLTHNDHVNEQPSENAREMFINNAFPDIAIVGPPGNDNIPIPADRQQLLDDLYALRKEMELIVSAISVTSFNGKTRHPGLQYFSALEWLQFADMHFRHHLRQKQRIDTFLKSETDRNNID